MAALSFRRALGYNVKFLNYSAVKNIKFQFDPFSESCASLREVMFVLSASDYKKTNPNTTFKYDVKSDRSPSLMEVKFADDHKALFKADTLSSVEIVQQFNKLCRQKEAVIEAQKEASKKKKR